jgi:molecular chaperone DnaJ
MTDPYEVLQVHQLAETEVIQAAFRVLARKHHPDSGGDPARMVALNEAWRILGNRKRRSAYDLKRRAAPPGSAPAPVVRSATEPIFDPYAIRSAPSEPGSTLDFGRYAG